VITFSSRAGRHLGKPKAWQIWGHQMPEHVGRGG
jgi:hypothetical protein